MFHECGTIRVGNYWNRSKQTKEVNSMGNRNINNKEVKKKKKTDAAAPAPSTLKSIVAQPEVIKKAKKPMKDED